jgi:hypothetical protein
MSRREAWLSAGLVFLVAFVVRVWAATLLTFPRPEDTAYYVDVAGNLLAGRGLTVDAIWSYGTPPLSFPRPAFEIWLPLTTFLDAVPLALLRGALGAFAAAQVASIVVGSLVSVLAWRLGADLAEDRELPVGRARTLALGTGLAAAFYLPLVLFSVQPDSTMPFTALVLATVLLGRRILALLVGGKVAAAPRGKVPRRDDPREHIDLRGYAHDGHQRRGPVSQGLDRALTLRLIALGGLLGLAGLTRNEAIWLALTWAVVAWWATRPAGPIARRLRAAVPLIGIPAAVALAVFSPWAIRDWLTFGSPLPGQALQNALFLKSNDVFAWNDVPTLDRYLGAGIGTLIGQRVTGLLHNLGSVLLLLGIPISAVGLAGLPWTARVRALVPLAVFSLTTFLVTALLFPVATTRGTFLHGSGAIHVLVLASALLVLDGLVERIRGWRDWTRPVAWLGAALAIAASAVLTIGTIPADGAAGDNVAARYRALPNALAQAGVPLPTDGSPVITDFPIWLATQTGVNAIALPDEQPSDVLDLANHFGAKLLIVDQGNDGAWPAILDQEAPGSGCFRIVPLPGVGDGGPLDDLVVFQIVCTAEPGAGTAPAPGPSG